MKLTIQNCVAKVDVETNARSRTCSRSSRLHVQMSKKSEHEQETQNESFMCDKEWFVGVTRRTRRNLKNLMLGGLIPADCVGREIWTRLR